jgi:hypothetical protein
MRVANLGRLSSWEQLRLDRAAANELMEALATMTTWTTSSRNSDGTSREERRSGLMTLPASKCLCSLCQMGASGFFFLSIAMTHASSRISYLWLLPDCS